MRLLIGLLLVASAARCLACGRPELHHAESIAGVIQRERVVVIRSPSGSALLLRVGGVRVWAKGGGGTELEVGGVPVAASRSGPDGLEWREDRGPGAISFLVCPDEVSLPAAPANGLVRFAPAEQDKGEAAFVPAELVELARRASLGTPPRALQALELPGRVVERPTGLVLRRPGGDLALPPALFERLGRHRGRTMVLLGDLDASGALVRARIPAHEENARAEALAERVAAGWKLMESDRYDEALLEFRRALELDPRDSDAHVGVGCAASELGEQRPARRSLDRALEVYPENRNGLVNRAILRDRTGDPKGALEDYDRALAIAPGDSRAMAHRGAVRMELADLRGALRDFEKALALDPDCAPAYEGRGRCRLAARDLDGAGADLERALELDPRLADALIARGELRAIRGDAAGACDDWELAVELLPLGSPRLEEVRGRLAELARR